MEHLLLPLGFLGHHRDALDSDIASVQDEEPVRKRVTWRHGKKERNQVLCFPLGCNLLTKFKFVFLCPLVLGVKVLLET